MWSVMTSIIWWLDSPVDSASKHDIWAGHRWIKFWSIYGHYHLTEVYLMIDFCQTGLLESFHSISGCSQLAAVLISVFQQWRSPYHANTIARWGGFHHPTCLNGSGNPFLFFYQPSGQPDCIHSKLQLCGTLTRKSKLASSYTFLLHMFIPRSDTWHIACLWKQQKPVDQISPYHMISFPWAEIPEVCYIS